MTGRMSSNDWSAMTGFVNIPHNDHQSTYEMMCEQYQKWAMATTVPHMTIKKHGGICEHLMLVGDEAFTNSAPRTPKASDPVLQYIFLFLCLQDENTNFRATLDLGRELTGVKFFEMMIFLGWFYISDKATFASFCIQVVAHIAQQWGTIEVTM